MLDIINRIDFEDNCWVGLINSSTFNRSETDRIQAVTDIASVTKGKLAFTADMEKRKHLYSRLLIESNNKPSTPFEFIPCTSKSYLNGGLETEETINNYYKYGHLHFDYILTNLRNKLTNYGEYDKYNTAEEVEDLKVIAGRVPIKVISHLRTHRAFSFLVESSRNRRYLTNVEFWYPSKWTEEAKTKFKVRDEYRLDDIIANGSFHGIPAEDLTMELGDRRMVHFAMCAWKQNPDAWDNLFALRGDKTGTMNITAQTVDNIKKLIYGI